MTIDLRSRYLGLELRSPIVASAAPQNGEPEMARRLEAAGVGAIVLPSLFEEEILAEELGINQTLEQGTELFAEALDYFPAVEGFVGAADRYVAMVEQVKAATGVPIIASLNATNTGAWVRYARLIQSAGADALELNLYHVAGDPQRNADGHGGCRPRADRCGPRGGHHPARGQAQPLLLRLRQLRLCGHRSRRRWARPVQPLLPAGLRPRGARGRAAARAEPAVGAAAAGALDRDAAAAARPRGLAGRHLGRAEPGPMSSRPSWSVPTW